MGKEKLPPTLDSLQAIVDDLEYEVDELKNKVEDLEYLKDSIPEDPKPDLDEIFARLNDIEARI